MDFVIWVRGPNQFLCGERRNYYYFLREKDLDFLFTGLGAGDGA